MNLQRGARRARHNPSSSCSHRLDTLPAPDHGGVELDAFDWGEGSMKTQAELAGKYEQVLASRDKGFIMLLSILTISPNFVSHKYRVEVGSGSLDTQDFAQALRLYNEGETI